MIDPIIDWFLKAIPTAYLADVFKLAFFIFSATQLVKISVRYTWSKPSAGFIHIVSVWAAVVAGGWMATGSVAEKSGVATVAWLVTFVVAKYGLAFLKWKWPTLWAAINLDRRKPRRDPTSPEGDERRDGP